MPAISLVTPIPEADAAFIGDLLSRLFADSPEGRAALWNNHDNVTNAMVARLKSVLGIKEDEPIRPAGDCPVFLRDMVPFISGKQPPHADPGSPVHGAHFCVLYNAESKIASYKEYWPLSSRLPPPTDYQTMSSFELSLEFAKGGNLCSEKVVDELKRRLGISEAHREMALVGPDTAYLTGMDSAMAVTADVAEALGVMTLLVSPPKTGQWSNHPYWHMYELRAEDGGATPAISIPWA